MNQRENLLALLRREPYEWVPPQFDLCPSLYEEYKKRHGEDVPYEIYFEFPWSSVDDIVIPEDTERFLKYHPGLKPGSYVDRWGVAHEPGSEAAKHMTYMRCPLKGVESLEEVKEYPFPDFTKGDASHQKQQAEEIHSKGLAAVAYEQTTIWETSWYIRGMEDLMMDMVCEDPIAEYILDYVTEQALYRAVAFAKAGVDVLYLGDDIGMQKTPMMSIDLYCQWIKPRLKEVIDAAHAVNPDIVVMYHSCGFATPFIQHLIEAGVDVLNPVQPESMDFAEVCKEFGGRISYHGTIGTQTTMPFGTPDDVKRTFKEHMELAGAHGGLWPAPTHLLEPEVPWENIEAYVEACREYKP